MIRFKHIFFILILLANTDVAAQIICKTSDVPNNASNCQQEFYDPVCGCDTVTYRHPCDATLIHNVQFYTDGICFNQLFTMDIYPSPATQANPIRLAIETQPNNPVAFTILIFDSWGILQKQRVIGNTTRFDWSFPSSGFKAGVYIAVAVNGATGFAVIKKFVVGSV